MKPVLVSGIQPTGKLHIGNYLGALKNFVDLQNSEKYNCYFFLADLHALTENPDAKELRGNILDLAANFLAAGLDPQRSIIFQQSQISMLEELKWILSPLVPVSELMRMTAFKEKVFQKMGKKAQHQGKEEFDQTTEESNMGLAEYPVLMAADILIYDGQFVPVGNDQLQHLELARTLTRKFNRRFGETFLEPKPLLTKNPRVMSLKDPSKKMSKSQPEGCLFLDDEPDVIRAKIARAVTDSGSEVTFDPSRKPGLANLLEVYAALVQKDPKSIAKEFDGKNYAEFKKALAGLMAEYFDEFRKKKKGLLTKPAALADILKEGSEKAQGVAEKKMAEVKKKVGLAL